MKGFIRKATLIFMLLALPVIASAEVVNINKADAQTLASELKGIGASKAEAIIKFRQEHGSFTSLDQLTLVPGVGDKLLSRLRPMLSLGSD